MMRSWKLKINIRLITICYCLKYLRNLKISTINLILLGIIPVKRKPKEKTANLGDFKEFCGTWSDSELAEFEDATNELRDVNHEDWKWKGLYSIPMPNFISECYNTIKECLKWSKLPKMTKIMESLRDISIYRIDFYQNTTNLAHSCAPFF